MCSDTAITMQWHARSPGRTNPFVSLRLYTATWGHLFRTSMTHGGGEAQRTNSTVRGRILGTWVTVFVQYYEMVPSSHWGGADQLGPCPVCGASLRQKPKTLVERVDYPCVNPLCPLDNHAVNGFIPPRSASLLLRSCASSYPINEVGLGVKCYAVCRGGGS